MAITKEKKAQILRGLIDKFGRSKSVVFSDYRGLDVASISTLRNQLREKGAETKVAKKTLIKLAAKESNIGELGDDVMEGPVSVTFSYEDELSGLKILFKFSKENENLKLLGGIIDGKVVSADEIITLAKLPGREELIAKFIGSMNAPVSGFVGTLSNLLSGMVRVLNAYKDTLPADTSAEASAKVEEIKTEEPIKEEEPKAEEKVEAAPETPKDTAEASPQEAGQAGDAVGAPDLAPDEGVEEKPTDEPADQPAEKESADKSEEESFDSAQDDKVAEEAVVSPDSGESTEEPAEEGEEKKTA